MITRVTILVLFGLNCCFGGSILIATNTAFWTNNLNSISIMQSLLTVSNTQYCAWYHTNKSLRWTTRDLTTDALSHYGPFTSMTTPDGDEHRTASFEFDKNGYCHLMYGYHGNSSGAHYRTGTTAWAVSAWSGEFLGQFSTSPRGGSPSFTYPFFAKHPITSELFVTMRDGASGYGDQLFYWWNSTNQVWTNAPGMATNMVINGLDDSLSPYLQGPPRWDGLGRMWLAWCFSTAGNTISSNQFVMYWDGGTNWHDASGSILTMPVNFASAPIAKQLNDRFSTSTMIQNQFCVQSNIAYIPYTRTNSSGIVQVYVLENSSGTFSEHVVSTYTNNPIFSSYAASVAATNGPVFIAIQNNSSPTNVFVAYISTDNFTTVTTTNLVTRYAPNFASVFDPELAKRGIFSQLFMHSDDVLYGATYVSNYVSEAERGKLWIEDYDFRQVATFYGYSIGTLIIGN